MPEVSVIIVSSPLEDILYLKSSVLGYWVLSLFSRAFFSSKCYFLERSWTICLPFSQQILIPASLIENGHRMDHSEDHSTLGEHGKGCLLLENEYFHKSDNKCNKKIHFQNDCQHHYSISHSRRDSIPGSLILLTDALPLSHSVFFFHCTLTQSLAMRL